MSNITIVGLVATTPRHLVTFEGLAITSFRLAEYDPSEGKETTNWYTVTAFRELGVNTASSIGKGDRVVVSGSLNIRDWDNGERTGTSVELTADVIGHDLNWGNSEFTRTPVEEKVTHSCDCGNCSVRE
jgi:single-strand DNA-binding protein